MPAETMTSDRRRLALQIAAQLPERHADALAVLDDARYLVDKFLMLPAPLVAPSPIK